MTKKSKIKRPENGNKQYKIKEPPEVINFDLRPPLFSLERLQPGNYCFSALSKDFKAAFAEAIFRRKDTNWRELIHSDRHALGLEKISKDSIKAAIPQNIKEDEKHFLAFRFHGKYPMVGYRVNDIFYILWFDHNCTLYDH